jgi:integrase
MAILAECPTCHYNQKVTNKQCSKCSEDLVQAKRSGRVKYWVAYRVPGNRKLIYQKCESIDDARALDGKRKGQKKENRHFEMLPESDATFEELSAWYLELEVVKGLKMFGILKIHTKIWNAQFGSLQINRLKKSSIENFRTKMLKAGKSRSYIDQIVGTARAMVNKAFEDDMLSGDCLRPFKKVKKLLKKNANARDMIFTREQYERLLANLPAHQIPIVATAYWTGMRRGEILGLTWDKVFMKDREIRLEIEDTKDDEKRVIPIPEALYKILSKIPRALHDNHVFLYKNIPLVNIREGFNSALKAAGIPCGRDAKGGLTFHDLRHTYVTDMRKAGVPDKLIMKITGHSTREMFDRYNTITADEKSIANEQLTKFRDGIETGKTEES